MNLHSARPTTAAALSGFEGAARAILSAQTPSGAIPWFSEGPWDPWNHAECVMALAVMGERPAAEAGLDFLQAQQAADGAWLGEYGNALPMIDRDRIARTTAPALKDTNFIAYPAVAVWRLFQLTGDAVAARSRWPMVRAAIDYVLTCQHVEGDISWCSEAHGVDGDDAILAGNASIYASLGCAIALAELAGEPRPDWIAARDRLRLAMLRRPDRFDRLSKGQADFAMDAYYPILAGVMPYAASLARLETRARPFIELGLGCRCVRTEPWVTVAESCELALALVRLGRHAQAARLLDWQAARRDSDGAFWMGWQFEESIVWPLEKPTWTQAAAILATDALHEATPGWAVLISS